MTAADPRPDDPALREMAHGVLDANRYLVLGTSERDGRPRVSPVYFTHYGYRHLYWVSSPASTHSGNVAADGRVGIVVFDSSRPTKETEAWEVIAMAISEPTSRSTKPAGAGAAAFARVSGGARPFAPEELSGDADLRLYRAVVEAAQVHVRGSHPVWGSGIDRRVTVQRARQDAVRRCRPDGSAGPARRDDRLSPVLGLSAPDESQSMGSMCLSACRRCTRVRAARGPTARALRPREGPAHAPTLDTRRARRGRSGRRDGDLRPRRPTR